VVANVLSNAGNTESDPRERVKSELASVQNAYGVYVERD
jgi:hypothetical protein